MATDKSHAVAFCAELHERLIRKFADAAAVRNIVASLKPRNSFSESCFCKGLVLPVIDALATEFLSKAFGASRGEIRNALRCEGFDTPMYDCDQSQVGFSSHSRSNSYHPGDKSGRRASSRRSPDFCIRFRNQFRIVGEMKYVESRGRRAQVVHELRDYLSIKTEPTSDWGHDFGFGLLYEFGRTDSCAPKKILEYWGSDGIFLSTFQSHS